MVNIINKIKQNPIISLVIFLLLSLIVGLAIGLSPKPASSIKNIQRYGATDTGSYFLKSDNSGNLSLYDPATTAFSSKQLNSTTEVAADSFEKNAGNPDTWVRINKSGRATDGTAVLGHFQPTKGIRIGNSNYTQAPQNNLCIGNTCITEDDLKKIRDNKFPNLCIGSTCIAETDLVNTKKLASKFYLAIGKDDSYYGNGGITGRLSADSSNYARTNGSGSNTNTWFRIE